jgi:hypothetical protein
MFNNGDKYKRPNINIKIQPDLQCKHSKEYAI